MSGYNNNGITALFTLNLFQRLVHTEPVSEALRKSWLQQESFAHPSRLRLLEHSWGWSMQAMDHIISCAQCATSWTSSRAQMSNWSSFTPSCSRQRERWIFLSLYPSSVQRCYWTCMLTHDLGACMGLSSCNYVCQRLQYGLDVTYREIQHLMQHVSSLNVVVVQALSRKKDIKSFSGLVYEGDDEVVSSIYSIWHSWTFNQSRDSTYWTFHEHPLLLEHFALQFWQTSSCNFANTRLKQKKTIPIC